jgi:hypothetical protein
MNKISRSSLAQTVFAAQNFKLLSFRPQLLNSSKLIQRFAIDDVGVKAQAEIESKNWTILIEALFRRRSFSIHESQSQITLISRLICQLKHEEISEQIWNMLVSIEEMNTRNCIEIYRLKGGLSVESSTEQKFISCHFCEIDRWLRI